MTYYDILGVDRDATDEEITEAYRELVKTEHPDQSDRPDANTRFKTITEAKEVLTDSERRAEYDEYLRRQEATTGRSTQTTDSSSSTATNSSSGSQSSTSTGSQQRDAGRQTDRSRTTQTESDHTHEQDQATPGSDDWSTAETYYDVLGVDPEASSAEIEHAYERLARQWHPDFTDRQNAETIFTIIKMARDTLTDSTKRAQYDSLGHQEYLTQNANSRRNRGSTTGSQHRSESSSKQQTATESTQSTGEPTDSSQRQTTTSSETDKSRRWQPADVSESDTVDPGVAKYIGVFIYWWIGTFIPLISSVALLPIYLVYRKNMYGKLVREQSGYGLGSARFVWYLLLLSILFILSASVTYSGLFNSTLDGVFAFLAIGSVHFSVKYLARILVTDWSNSVGTTRPVAWDFASRAPLVVIPILIFSDSTDLLTVLDIHIVDILTFIPMIVSVLYAIKIRDRILL